MGDTDHKPSQADAAHIATAEYWRGKREGIDRIAKLKALRLAQEAKDKSPKPKSKRKKVVTAPATGKAARKRRWGV